MKTIDSDRSDEALAQACLDGDRGAWEALVGRYGRLVHGIATRSGLNPDEGEDVHQIVFVQVYRGLGLLDHPGAIRSWIATIARREAWRAARGRRRALDPEARAVVPDDAAAILHAGPRAADDPLERVERAFLVERGLERLDDRCRRLLRMLFYEEPTPSYEETAERLDVPLGSVGPTRARCLDKLRRLLEEAGF